jgi:hypothetical protein
MRRTLTLIWTVLTVGLIVTSLSPVMAQDIRIENYKNTVSSLVGRWAAAEIALASKLGPILDELAQKQAIPSLLMRTRRGSPNCRGNATLSAIRWITRATIFEWS